MIKKVLLVTFALAQINFVFASAQIEQSIMSKYPNTQIDTITQTPMKGIYEVKMGKNIAYTDEEGRYFLFGHLFDMNTQTDLTAEAKKAAEAIKWQELPLENALVYKKGDGSRVFGMVTDIDCGYCRMLEREIQAMDNITVYKFMVPIQGNPKDSENIWCAADRNQAYLNRILDNIPAPDKTCQNPIAKNVEWFDANNLTGTPVLFKPNGDMQYGYTTKSELEEWLK
ncbi:hypothetical protein AAX09_10320 (plasmid) [Moraxella bovoculi]|uniref:DsbC family protein n=1 Tax=Moraxella bovoculi TaxID=386891 RepID=UPI000624EE38|nr:hypothetical protein AAX09_10320 [Moraxella bovoculi]